MPSIRDRDEGNARRKERLAQLKRGPGLFVYNGGAFDVEHVPTPLLVGKDVPMLTDDGMPVLDAAGRQVFKPAGRHATDSEGHTIMGGVPKVVKHPIKVFELRGVRFPIGEPVEVSDGTLAIKLRGMDCFEEVEPGARKQDIIKQEPGALSWHEIRRLAKETGIEFTPSTGKDELVAKLREAGVQVD